MLHIALKVEPVTITYMEGDYEKDYMEDERPEKQESQLPKRPHYYGDVVRQVLFAIGIIMLVGLPIFSDRINFSAFFLLLVILGVNLFAGFTNPKQTISIWGDFFISFTGLIFFELIAFFYFGVYHTVADLYFWFNQSLAILFFISLYFSVKTLRGMMIPPVDEEDF